MDFKDYVLEELISTGDLPADAEKKISDAWWLLKMFFDYIKSLTTFE